MSDTEVLPYPVLPATGVYALRRDRCVIELSIRLLGRPLLRGRFAAAGGRFTIADPLEFFAVLDSASLRTGVPLLHRALTGHRGFRRAELTFSAQEIVLDADHVLDLVGRLTLPGCDREIHLRGDLRHVDDERIVVWAAGVLPPPRRGPRALGRIARLLARRNLHIEIAIEFVR
jgi:hypothetical protein